MIKSNSKLSQAPGVETTQVGDDAILVRESDGAHFGLNQVGRKIWERLAESQTASALVDRLVEEFDVTREECEGQVNEHLGQLQEKELIVTS